MLGLPETVAGLDYGRVEPTEIDRMWSPFLSGCVDMVRYGGGFRGWWWHWHRAEVVEYTRKPRSMKAYRLWLRHPDGRKLELYMPTIRLKLYATEVEVMCRDLAVIFETTPEMVARFLLGELK